MFIYLKYQALDLPAEMFNVDITLALAQLRSVSVNKQRQVSVYGGRPTESSIHNI